MIYEFLEFNKEQIKEFEKLYECSKKENFLELTRSSLGMFNKPDNKTDAEWYISELFHSMLYVYGEKIIKNEVVLDEYYERVQDGEFDDFKKENDFSFGNFKIKYAQEFL
jgi:hypothetical protein